MTKKELQEQIDFLTKHLNEFVADNNRKDADINNKLNSLLHYLQISCEKNVKNYRGDYLNGRYEFNEYVFKKYETIDKSRKILNSDIKYF